MKTNDSPYSGLAMFSVIIAEMVITPASMGGLLYWFTGYLGLDQSKQLWISVAGALFGLIIAFYRINLLSKRWSKPDPTENSESK